MQPPRGPRAEAAVDVAKVIFLVYWAIGIPHMFFDVHYPLWLRWIGRALLAIFAIAVLSFAALRTHEVIGYRRQEPDRESSSPDQL